MGVVVSNSLPPTESEDLDVVWPGYFGVTPPPGPPPARGERLWIDRPEQLLHAVDILRQASIVAIDAEFTQVRSHTHTSTSSNRLALLQLAIDHQCFVVDAWRLADLSPLLTVTEDPHTSILLYGAGADLQVMTERGLTVAHYIDLEAANRSIFGQHESSLAAMLQRAFNIRLDKSLQRTDWTRRPLPTAMAVKEAIEQGLLQKEQVYADCRAALATLVYPMQQSRLLRLIADLSLVQMAEEIEPLLHVQASDERAAAVRTLARLMVEQGTALIRPLLQDPVYDVRKAAQTALRNLSVNAPPQQRTVPTRLADGSRSWTVGETGGTTSDDDKSEWKARLRAMMDK